MTLLSVKPLCTLLNVTIQNTQWPSWNVFVFLWNVFVYILNDSVSILKSICQNFENICLNFLFSPTLLYKITLHLTKCDYSEYTMPPEESFSISRYLYTLAQNPWRCHIYSYIQIYSILYTLAQNKIPEGATYLEVVRLSLHMMMMIMMNIRIFMIKMKDEDTNCKTWIKYQFQELE